MSPRRLARVCVRLCVLLVFARWRERRGLTVKQRNNARWWRSPHTARSCRSCRHALTLNDGLSSGEVVPVVRRHVGWLVRKRRKKRKENTHTHTVRVYILRHQGLSSATAASHWSAAGDATRKPLFTSWNVLMRNFKKLTVWFELHACSFVI